MLTAVRGLPFIAAASAASSLARLSWLNAIEPLSAGAAAALVAGAAAELLAGAAAVLLAGAVEVDDEVELEQAAARDIAATAGMAASALRVILIAMCPSWLVAGGGSSLVAAVLPDGPPTGPKPPVSEKSRILLFETLL
jgi:hypothetical protein